MSNPLPAFELPNGGALFNLPSGKIWETDDDIICFRQQSGGPQGTYADWTFDENEIRLCVGGQFAVQRFNLGYNPISWHDYVRVAMDSIATHAVQLSGTAPFVDAVVTRLKLLAVAQSTPAPATPDAPPCPECNDTGLWTNPAGGRQVNVPCSLGCSTAAALKELDPLDGTLYLQGPLRVSVKVYDEAGPVIRTPEWFKLPKPSGTFYLDGPLKIGPGPCPA